MAILKKKVSKDQKSEVSEEALSESQEMEPETLRTNNLTLDYVIQCFILYKFTIRWNDMYANRISLAKSKNIETIVKDFYSFMNFFEIKKSVTQDFMKDSIL